ncbi:TrkA family potassium uptake protein [Jeotgalibaca sp. MA1X17-3]|uniref:potassium channel family protein n=1 Tax=Jeotgalibaca sp. MA1X17-3 TaxID=2908211 RepID=UPI001F3BB130|nr:TrkA family potassium uptake protein [Jeotgalibaca sp. MA1X17-3]UJF15949.1 TrkA family potassium uptake protein [Jeotgalibaca sp. MA1X17-3]
MRKTIGILGLGIFGSTIAKTLAENDFDVIVLDKSAENVNRLEHFTAKGVIGDMTDLELLEAIGLAECDAVVIASGTNLESSILALMNCKKLGIKKIIAKAKNKMFQEVLEQMGATSVILPEKLTGIRVAKNLMRTSIQDIVELDEYTSIIEFLPPKKWIGKRLDQLDLRNRYEINIIGMRKTKGARLNVGVSSDTIIEEQVVLVGIAESDLFERYDYLNELE